MPSWRYALTGRPSVSVVMATYNGERYLPEMLETIAAQTRPPDELVVRDDASEDGTVGILHAFARRVPFRVEVIAGDQRLGYAQNFVAATRACSGDVVFFADQDDWWRVQKLATVSRQLGRLGRLARRRPMAVFHDFTLRANDRSVISPSYYGLLAERAYPPEVAVKGCTMSVTRAFLDLWGLPPADSRVSHDVWVALLATAFGQRRNLAEPLIDHRLHDANASGWIPDETSRVFTQPGDDPDPSRLLVDLVIKPPRLGARTRALLDVLDRRGDAVDPAAAARLRALLRENQRRHRQREDG